MAENLLAIQETWVQSLGREDSLEKEMAAHSSTLAWRIPLTEESGWLQSMKLQRVRHDLATNTQENIPGLDSGHENMTVLEACEDSQVVPDEDLLEQPSPC